MYTLETNNTFPSYILCTLMPQIIPLRLPILTLVRTWHEESNSRVIFLTNETLESGGHGPWSLS